MLKQATAFITGFIVVMTMSCCATLQAAIQPQVHTTAHACCEKKDESKTDKKAPSEKHNCECEAKLVSLAENHSLPLQNFHAVELPEILSFQVATFFQEEIVAAIPSTGPPSSTTPLRHLYCSYQI